MKGVAGIMDQDNIIEFDSAQTTVPALTQILLKYEEEAITTEQTQRILEPVLDKISEGSFNRMRRKGSKRFLWI